MIAKVRELPLCPRCEAEVSYFVYYTDPFEDRWGWFTVPCDHSVSWDEYDEALREEVSRR